MKRTELLIESRRGLTLIVSMILLMVMSLIGVAVVNISVQESKIAQNYEGAMAALAWAEAGVEAARQKIIDAPNPDMSGYQCDPAEPNTTHWYPDPVTRRVKYCIELLKMEMKGDVSKRGSGQESARGTKTYYYKIDAYVDRTTGTGEEVTIRHVQTLEQQTRYSI